MPRLAMKNKLRVSGTSSTARESAWEVELSYLVTSTQKEGERAK
jgi:hypothetical protein